MIRNFVSVVAETRAQLEEQQLHINIGLEKLASTQTDVEALQKELATKREELRGKDTLANAKLQQMIGDQNEAEKRKTDADNLSQELDKQNIAIAARREEVQKDLAEAEPALIAAQGAVKCKCTGLILRFLIKNVYSTDYMVSPLQHTYLHSHQEAAVG